MWRSADTKRQMKWVLFFLLFCSALASVQGANSLSNAKGMVLAQQMYDRPAGDDVSSRVIMLLLDKDKKKRQRVLYSYAKDKGAAERWTLMRFVKPTDIEGTGLLTLDHPGDNSEQWIYLPALDRVRRISSSRKGGRFVGSDFFYEDLRDREVEMDYHRHAGKGKVGKIPCEILVSTPKESDNSIYSKRISWVHRKSLVPLRIDFYKKGKKKPIKRLRARKLKKKDGFWTVMDSTMYDLKSGHRTRLVTKRIKYDQGLPDSLFTQRALSDDAREQAFRP